MSTIWGLIMISILIAAIARMLNSSVLSPSSILFCSLISIFLITAILHPREFTCIFPSLLYFVSSPSTFILLNIYGIANLNNISWGTRETKASSDAEVVSAAYKKGYKKMVQNYLKSMFRKKSRRKRTYSSVTMTENFEKQFDTVKVQKKVELVNDECVEAGLLKSNEMSNSDETDNDELVVVTNWFAHASLDSFRLDKLNESETVFFEKLIGKYLRPFDAKKEAAKKIEIGEDLKVLRNASFFYFIILNSYWILSLFTLQLFKDKFIDKIYIRVNIYDFKESYEPVSFCYVMLFVVMLFLQFFTMLWHRVITLIQIIRKTSLRRFKNSKAEAIESTVCIPNGNVNNDAASGNENLVFDFENEKNQVPEKNPHDKICIENNLDNVIV